MTDRNYTGRQIEMDLIAGALMALVLRLMFANIWLGLVAAAAIGTALVWPHIAFLKKRAPAIVSVTKAIDAYVARGSQIALAFVLAESAVFAYKAQAVFRKGKTRFAARKRYSRAFRSA